MSSITGVMPLKLSIFIVMMLMLAHLWYAEPEKVWLETRKPVLGAATPNTGQVATVVARCLTCAK